MLVFKDFARDLPALNASLPSESLIATPAGRAYKTGDKLYADDVFLELTGEDEAAHVRLQDRFHARAGAFPDTVYAGAAGLINLSNVAAAAMPAAIFYDVNIVQTMFNNALIGALADNPFAAGCAESLGAIQNSLPEKIEALFDALKPVRPNRHYFTSAQTIFRGIDDVRHWLDQSDSTPRADRRWLTDNYRHLHDMARHRAMGALTLDVTDTKACAQLQDFLGQVTFTPTMIHADGSETRQAPRVGTSVGVFYASNILLFLGGKTDWTGRPLDNATPLRAWKNIEPLMARENPVFVDGMARNISLPALGFA